MEKFYQIVEDIRTQSDLIKFRLMYEENKIFVIFGAGDCGHCIYNMLHNTSINVAYFCDNKMGGLIDEITGLKIISPKDLNTNMSELVLLICTIDVNAITSIYKQLLTQGFEKAQIFNMREYFFRVPLSYLEDHIEEYKKAYRMLQEETSKQVYLARMKRSFIIGDLSEVISPHEKEYFDEMIKLTQEEVFIDCGGFDGDTSIKFLEMCQGRYKDIVIFEPEACKKNAIEKNLMEYRYELYQMGVWSKSTILNFYALGTDSSFVTDKESDYMIDVVSLDEAIIYSSVWEFKNRNYSVCYINVAKINNKILILARKYLKFNKQVYQINHAIGRNGGLKSGYYLYPTRNYQYCPSRPGNFGCYSIWISEYSA